MSSSDSYIVAILTSIPIYVYRFVIPVLFVLGNLGNLFTVFIFSKKTWRKNVCVFYFLICLLTDFIFINSTIFGSILILGFNINIQNSNVILCKLFYYISYACSVYLPLILILASIDRLLVSSQNVDTRLYSSKRLAYLSIGISASVCIIYSLHILIQVNIQQLYPTIFICYYDLSPFYSVFLAYTTLIQSILIPLIMIILSILSFKNVRRIQSIPRQQRQNIRSMNKKDFQLLRCLYVHNIIYILCSIVLAVGVIFSTVTQRQLQTSVGQEVSNFLNSFGSFLHHIPYCVSFFIFVYFSKAFRMELKKIMFKICGQNLIAATEDDQHQHHHQITIHNHIDQNDIVDTIQ